MSHAAIRSRLKTILDGVTDLGKVYDYRRLATEFNDYLALFKTTIDREPQIRGAFIWYSSFDPDPYQFGIAELRAHNFRVSILLRFDDSAESEKTAVDLCESVADAIIGDATLIDQASYMGFPVVSLAVFDERLFGDVLCHYGELHVVIQERV